MHTTYHNGAHGQNERGRRPRPLSITQRRAIELLLKGLSDSQVAAELRLRRETINRWKHHHTGFRAALAGEQERLWLLGRAQREIEVAKRHTPPAAPPPLDDERIEDDLRRSPALRAALRKQALLWVNYEKAEPLTPEDAALLHTHPEHVAYAVRQMRALWNRTNAAGEHVGIMLFYSMLEMNEMGEGSEHVPFWLNQPRQLTEEEKRELEERETQAAVEWVRELEVDGMSHEAAVRDIATVCGVPVSELEKRLAASPLTSHDVTPKNCPENMRGSE